MMTASSSTLIERSCFADCLNRTDYDHGRDHDHDHDPNPYPGQGFASDEVDYEDAAGEHPFSALKKLLSAGYFYYSVDFDLTSRLQDRWVKQVSLQEN